MLATKQNAGYVNADDPKPTASVDEAGKQRSYQLMHLKTGQRVLDVGCGAATDTLALGQLVGSGGRVIGVDDDPELITLAMRQAQQAGLSAWVAHELADALALPYEVNSFDAARCERLFEHVSAPKKALDEMIRVTKPGGRVVVSDTDWTSPSIGLTDTNIEWQLRKVKAEQSIANGTSGRQLYRLFRQAGLENVTCEFIPLYLTRYDQMRLVFDMDQAERTMLRQGMVTYEELDVWNEVLQEADVDGTFFACVMEVIVAGSKP